MKISCKIRIVMEANSQKQRLGWVRAFEFLDRFLRIPFVKFWSLIAFSRICCPGSGCCFSIDSGTAAQLSQGLYCRSTPKIFVPTFTKFDHNPLCSTGLSYCRKFNLQEIDCYTSIYSPHSRSNNPHLAHENQLKEWDRFIFRTGEG